MERCWRLPAAVALAIASALLLSGCIMITESGGGSTSQGSATSAPQAKVTASASSRVGESQTSGNWKLTVNDVQMQNKLVDGAAAAPGNKLMSVDVSFFNVGTGNALVVRPGQATLTDSKNKVVAEFPTKLGAFNGQGVGQVQVAYGSNSSYVYEIPAGATGYIWSFRPDPSGKIVLRWRVP